MCTMVKLKQMSGGTDLKKRGKGVEQGKNDGGKNLRSKVTEKKGALTALVTVTWVKKKKGGVPFGFFETSAAAASAANQSSASSGAS